MTLHRYRRPTVLATVLALAAVLASCVHRASTPIMPASTPTAAATMPVPPSPTPTPLPAPLQYCVATGVAAGRLHVRSGPGMQYPAIAILTEGQPVTIVTPPAAPWQRIASPVAGWVASRYLEPCQEVKP